MAAQNPVTGEDRLDNLITIVVFLIGVAQALTMLLTFRRERDINELRSIVDEQGLKIVELKALLARRNTRQSRPAKSEREPTSLRAKLKQAAPTEPAIALKALPDTPSATENELERTTKVISWLNRVAIDHTAAAGRSTGSR